MNLNITLQVHTTAGEDFKIPLGSNDETQAQNILGMLVNSFNTLAPSRALVLTDVHGIHHVFNTDNITGVEVLSGYEGSSNE